MRSFNKYSTCLLVGVSLIAGCASEPTTPTTKVSTSEHIVVFKDTPAVDTEQQLRNQVELFYNDWKGTPYRFGGNSKRGIDCSALIQVVMTQVFDKEVPRTTVLQTQIGSKINQSSAKFGDLVFFKTGRNQRHVGLYLGDGTFMHASSSRGVMISSVNNVYWKKHFWHYRTYSDV